jgi:hypothetical protein
MCGRAEALLARPAGRAAHAARRRGRRGWRRSRALERARLGERSAGDRIAAGVDRDLLRDFGLGLGLDRIRRLCGSTCDHVTIRADLSQFQPVRRERKARGLHGVRGRVCFGREQIGRHQVRAVDDVDAAGHERLEQRFDAARRRRDALRGRRESGQRQGQADCEREATCESPVHPRSLPVSCLPVARIGAAWPPSPPTTPASASGHGRCHACGSWPPAGA